MGSLRFIRRANKTRARMGSSLQGSPAGAHPGAGGSAPSCEGKAEVRTEVPRASPTHLAFSRKVEHKELRVLELGRTPIPKVYWTEILGSEVVATAVTRLRDTVRYVQVWVQSLLLPRDQMPVTVSVKQAAGG